MGLEREREKVKETEWGGGKRQKDEGGGGGWFGRLTGWLRKL